MWWFLVIPPSQIEPNSDWCMIVACHYENIPRSQFLTKIPEKTTNTIQKREVQQDLKLWHVPIRFKQTQSTNQINTINKTNKTHVFDVFLTKNPPPPPPKKKKTNVPGFYCDILVLSPESWRHLGAGAGTVVPLVRAGLESYDGPQGANFFSIRWEVWCPLATSWRISLQWKGLNEPGFSAGFFFRSSKWRQFLRVQWSLGWLN